MKKIYLPLIFLLFVATACVDYEMKSERTNDKIIIDGNDSDWQGKLQFFGDERFAIGFRHDDENLYLCITTNDRNKARRFLMPGMNIWFGTGDDRNYAVRFPLLEPEQIRDRTRRGNAEQDEKNNVFRDIISDQQMFLLINEDDYPLGTYSINGNSGIKLKAGMTKDKFVFELQYALNPYNDEVVNFLKLKDNNKLAIKFESIEFRKVFAGPGGGKRGGGAPGGLGGRKPGGMSGGGSGRMDAKSGLDKDAFEDIDFTVNVILVD